MAPDKLTTFLANSKLTHKTEAHKRSRLHDHVMDESDRRHSRVEYIYIYITV